MQESSLSVKQVAAVAVVVMVTQRDTRVLSSQDIQWVLSLLSALLPVPWPAWLSVPYSFICLQLKGASERFGLGMLALRICRLWRATLAVPLTRGMGEKNT